MMYERVMGCSGRMNDILSVEGMLPFLPYSGCIDKIFVYDSLESTNQTAKEMAAAGAEHGTVVIADSQTSGKGQHGRSFFSPPGCGIYMSIVLRPEQLNLETPSFITILAVVLVCEAIEAVSGKDTGIKWVNDIFIDGKKVCGILTEAAINPESTHMQWAVVGIGVNYSSKMTDFPEVLRHTAGSIFPNGDLLKAGAPITRNRLAAEIVNQFSVCGSFKDSRPYSEKEIVAQYKKRLLTLDKKVLVSTRGESYKAVAIDIDDRGGLIVQRENGQVESLLAGEVTLL